MKKGFIRTLVLATVLLATAILAGVSLQSQNQNMNPFLYQTLFPYMSIPANQPTSAKATTWGDKTVIGVESYSNMEIILNGNLTIAGGGSLTLTNVTLMVNCTYDGEHRIEVQSGGAMYISDTDGNPDTGSDASNITAYDSGYRFLFWVRSGAVFQMINSELHCCGYRYEPTSNYDHWGLWINTNNTVIENNTFSGNYDGIILYYVHHNTIRNNKAINNVNRGFYLGSNSCNNTLSGNTANSNGAGFSLGPYSCNNNLSGNTANSNGAGFMVYSYSDKNTFSGNTANNNAYGFWLRYSSYNTISGNNADNNTYGFVLDAGSDKNNLSGNNANNNTYYGFYLYSRLNTFSGNTANNNTYGFYLYSGSDENTFSGNTVNNNVAGFYLCSSLNTFSGNTVNNNTYGFYLYSGYSNNISGNTVNDSTYGFYLYRILNKNTVSGNTVNGGTYGFYLFGSSNSDLDLVGNTVINSVYGFWLDSSSGNTLHANVVINSTSAYYLDGNSVDNDLAGSAVLNYLCVRVLDRNGVSVQGAEVKVEVDGKTVYASPGFGGGNSSTDENGLIPWVAVAFQTCVDGAWVENTVRVSVSYGELYFIDNYRIIRMSTSHTETFTAGDAPPIPETPTIPPETLILFVLLFMVQPHISFANIIGAGTVFVVVIVALAIALRRLRRRGRRGSEKYLDKLDKGDDYLEDIDEYGEIRRKWK